MTNHERVSESISHAIALRCSPCTVVYNSVQWLVVSSWDETLFCCNCNRIWTMGTDKMVAAIRMRQLSRNVTVMYMNIWACASGPGNVTYNGEKMPIASNAHPTCIAHALVALDIILTNVALASATRETSNSAVLHRFLSTDAYNVVPARSWGTSESAPQLRSRRTVCFCSNWAAIINTSSICFRPDPTPHDQTWREVANLLPGGEWRLFRLLQQ